jgi:hypothetical protein
LALRDLRIKTSGTISSHCQDQHPIFPSPLPNLLSSNVFRGLSAFFSLFRRTFFSSSPRLPPPGHNPLLTNLRSTSSRLPAARQSVKLRPVRQRRLRL